MISEYWNAVGEGATAVGVAVAVGSPFFLAWRDRLRSEREAERRGKLWLFGDPGVEGIEPAIIAAPLEMLTMKKDIANLQSDVSIITGTVDGIKTVVESIEKKITPNGGQSKDLGDIVQRMARSSGDWEPVTKDSP